MHIRSPLLRGARGRAAIVLAISSGTLVGCDQKSAPVPVSKVIADSVTDFSHEQGANGWFYGYWDRTADPDQTYDQERDFHRLKHFGKDPKNRLSGREEFAVGDLWNLEDGRFYTSLWAEGGHPNTTMQLGNYAKAEQWAVRRWVSAYEGRVTIRGHMGKVMPWGANWNGHCQARIVADGKTLFTGVMDNDGADYAVDADVEVGSTVDFLIGPGPSIGVTTFTATVQSSTRD